MSMSASWNGGAGLVVGAEVETSSLTKTYGRSGAEVHAVRGVDLRVDRGERVGLLGKSGSGKSTLLVLLGGLDRPTTGNVRVDGLDLARIGARGLAAYRLGRIGVIFQSYNLIGWRTVLGNVELPMILGGVDRRTRRRVAAEAIDGVGLVGKCDRRPSELSGGERQRVAIARALVNRPGLVLADEPTGNLDSATAREVMDLLLADVAGRGASLVLITHDEELALASTDRIVRLRDGQVVGEETR